MNLLVNSFQAIEERVGDSGDTGSIRLQTQLRDGCIAIEIIDDGVGVEAENLDRIFDPFFTTKRTGEGTGLGLSVSLGIVERHGGQLLVESEEGKGTVFTMRLPTTSKRMAVARVS
ncbi:MAG: hypothetical protein IH825_08790 [Candidatus Marinimicrobia bacterium]|nr:hypothetical protein [Candidatus Neomarinimicrobiota bacterium]